MALGGRPKKPIRPELDYAQYASREQIGQAVRSTGIREVARRAGIDASTIADWLNGHTQMALETRLWVAECVGWVVTVRVAPKRVNKRAHNDI